MPPGWPLFGDGARRDEFPQVSATASAGGQPCPVRAGEEEGEEKRPQGR